MVLSSYGNEIFRRYYSWQKWCSCKKNKIRNQRSQPQRSKQILPQFGRFRTVTPVWIHRWLRNDAQSLKWCRRGVLLFFKVICQVSRSHGRKINDSVSGWAFPACNSSLYSEPATKWCTNAWRGIGEVAYCFFLCHSLNFNVTWAEKLTILTWFEYFRTVTPVRIHKLLRNDA